MKTWIVLAVYLVGFICLLMSLYQSTIAFESEKPSKPSKLPKSPKLFVGVGVVLIMIAAVLFFRGCKGVTKNVETNASVSVVEGGESIEDGIEDDAESVEDSVEDDVVEAEEEPQDLTDFLINTEEED